MSALDEFNDGTVQLLLRIGMSYYMGFKHHIGWSEPTLMVEEIDG